MDHEFRRALRATTIAELEPAEALTVRGDAPASVAADMMASARHGCILVTGENGELAGIFTERDMIRRLLAPDRPLGTPVHAVMTPDPERLSPRDSAARALGLFVRGGYRHVPVVGDAGPPVGIISVKHFIRWLARLCPEAVYSPPPDPDHVVPVLDGG